MSDRRTTQPTTGKPGVKARLDELARRAELVLAWERLWPAIVPVLVVGGFFIAVSWLGLWLEVPRWGRIGGVLVFAAALAAALFHLARFVRPSRAEALARLDRDLGLPHRPASTLDDHLANATDDQATRVLWDVHRRRAEKAAATLRLRLPSPRMAARDRYRAARRRADRRRGGRLRCRTGEICAAPRRLRLDDRGADRPRLQARCLDRSARLYRPPADHAECQGRCSGRHQARRGSGRFERHRAQLRRRQRDG